jgi:hypothetical protein
MNAVIKSVTATFTFCSVAALLLLKAEPPLDSYLEEYWDECVLAKNCPVIDWADQHDGFLIVPRQFHVREDGTGVDILKPVEIPMIDVEEYRAKRNRPPGCY